MQLAAGYERPLVWCEDKPVSPAARAWARERKQLGVSTMIVQPKRQVGLSVRERQRILNILPTF